MRIPGDPKMTKRDRLAYCIGKLDGLICAGCDFDAGEFRNAIEPVYDGLVEILKEDENNEIPGKNVLQNG